MTKWQLIASYVNVSTITELKPQPPPPGGDRHGGNCWCPERLSGIAKATQKLKREAGGGERQGEGQKHSDT